MKNAMKKIMSLVLVAMILVSALPFAASASEAPAVPTVMVHLNGTYVTSVEGPVGSIANFDDCVAVAGVNLATEEVTDASWKKHGGDWHSLISEKTFVVDEAAYYYVYIETAPKTVTPPPTPTPTPTPTAYPMSIDVDGVQKVLTDRVSITYEEVLQMTGLKAADIDYIVYEGSKVDGTQMLDAGDKIDLAGETRIFVFTEEDTTPPATTTPSTGNTTNNGTGSTDDGYHKLSGTVTLRIQLKGTNTYKDIAIKDGIAADGKVTLNEVKSVVKYYYNAIDTDTGIVYDGIYIDDSVYSLWMSYAYDQKYSEVLGLYDAAYNNNDVRLTVVISNAKLASNSSSNADSTNPKTGDNIMMPAMIMTVTASVLAVAFFFNKKRAI